MIAAVAQTLRSNRRLAIGTAAVLTIALAATVVALLPRSNARSVPASPEAVRGGEVEHVRSGHKIILDDGEEVLYAGIRAPYEDEPLFDEAKARNTELVGGKTVRLRYDESAKDKKERFVAYVFADGALVNEQLVREGLAYAHLTTDHRRFEKELLAAQAEARKHRQGLWNLPAPAKETQYPADPKYGNFHRPTCAEVPKIKPERLQVFAARNKALDAGFAPCHHCRP